MPQAYENRIAGIRGVNILYEHVLQSAAINTLQSDGRAIGVLNRYVADGDVAETAPRSRTELYGTGTAANVAVLNEHILITGGRIVGFQADAVISRIYAALADMHLLTVGNVNTVVVPISAVCKIDSVNGKIAA